MKAVAIERIFVISQSAMTFLRVVIALYPIAGA
jgi:hypothetical protein